MLQKSAFFLLAWVSCLPLAFGQAPSATYDYDGHHYRYTLTPGSSEDRQKLLISVVTGTEEGDTSQLAARHVYNTEVQLAGNSPLKEARIFRARRSDYGWGVSGKEYFTAFYQHDAKRIFYQTVGKLLSKQEEHPAYDPTTMEIQENDDDAHLLEHAVQEFIRRFHHRAFALPGANRKMPLRLHGEVHPTYSSETYHFEVKFDDFKEGDHMIIIRHPDRSLAYKSMLRIEDNRPKHEITVRVYLAEPKDFTWAVYGSEYLGGLIKMDEGVAEFNRGGMLFPKPEHEAPESTQFEPHKVERQEAIEMAVAYLVEHYPKLFLVHE